MRHFRALVRLFFVAVVTLSLYLLYLGGHLICKLFRQHSEPLRNRCLTLWGGLVAAILNMKIQISGRPPRPPFYLVSNHLSYIDIVALYRTLDCTFIARMDVSSWPVIGTIARSMGVIFIDRAKRTDVKRVNRLISESLNRYQGIVIFPEGGTTSGREVLPFKASLLKHPADDESPVHYASITYQTSEQDPSASETICWWDNRSFPEHVYQLAGNRSIRCQLTFGGDTVQESDRKELAKQLHEKVSRQFTPVSEPQESGVS